MSFLPDAPALAAYLLACLVHLQHREGGGGGGDERRDAEGRREGVAQGADAGAEQGLRHGNPVMSFLPDAPALAAYLLACLVLWITPGPDMSRSTAEPRRQEVEERAQLRGDPPVGGVEDVHRARRRRVVRQQAHQPPGGEPPAVPGPSQARTGPRPSRWPGASGSITGRRS
jgi:hypothetical protein